MPKLAIYVPKKDMRQIEKWREKLNFSRVFMKALMAEIHELERSGPAPKSEKNKIKKAAEFYRRQMIDSGADELVDQGFTIGHQHVLECKLTTSSIRQLLQMDPETLTEQDISQLGKSIGDEMTAINNMAKQHGFDDQSRPAWTRAVFRGYLKGVAAAWQKICEQMN